MIVLQDVHTAHALRGVSLSVEPGEVVALIGPSGAGKSTLLRALIGLEPVTAGRVTCFGASDAAARQLVGFCFQDFQLFPHLTVVQNVALALRVRGVADAETKAEGWLARVACLDLKYRKPADLSGGQKQRVALARALALEPCGMLLDEPVSALDPECVVDVVDECRNLKDSNKAVIVTTHHLGFARAIATRVVFLVEGRVVEEGAPRDLFASPKTARLREYLAHCLA